MPHSLREHKRGHSAESSRHIATLLPLFWKTEQEAELLVETASRCAARIVEEAEGVTSNVVQTTGLVAKAGVLSLGAVCLWFVGS